MTFRIHPILLLWFCLLLITGQAGLFSVVFVSLFFHELGHICALKLLRVQDVKCMLLPFGGRIEWTGQIQWTKAKQLFVYSGGPLATFALIALILALPLPIPHQILQIQWWILLVNLLPIPPLDGGNMVHILFAKTPFQAIANGLSYIALAGASLFAAKQFFIEANAFPMVVVAVLLYENYLRIKS